MRVLTTKFSTYRLGKYEKATGKGVMDLLDIGNLEVSKIAEIIKLGNQFPKGCDEDEEAYNKRQLVKIPEREIFRIRYSKEDANYNNKSFIEFQVNRDIKVRLKQKIKNNEIEAFSYGNRKK